MRFQQNRGLAHVLFMLLATTNASAASPLFNPAAASPITVGSRPTGVATGDFDGDGKQDIAVALANDNKVRVLIGDGAGAFTAAPGGPVAVGTFPIAVVATDLNGDGKVDLAVVNATSNDVTILLGNGTGGFAAASGSPVSVGNGPSFAVSADFNGDTFPDLAVTNYVGGTVTVLLGNGLGGFDQAVGSPYTTGSGPRGIVTFDLNKDGKPDLAVGSQIDNKVYTLIGDGAGAFTAGTANEGASHPSVVTGAANVFGMTAGDFLGRGIIDVVTANFGTGRVSLLKGDGAGDLFYDNEFSAINFPINVLSGDFDGDGKLDVAVLCTGTNRLQLLLGNGAGGFDTSTPPLFDIGRSAWGIASADFNGDGKPDLVVSGQNDDNLTVLLSVIPPVTPPVITPPGPLPQTISLSLRDHLGSDAPFAVKATASSGLPVMLTLASGPATLSGDTITLTGLGTVTIVATQSGNASYLPAELIASFRVNLGAPSIRSVVNGASFSTGPITAGSFATLFGTNLAAGSFKGAATSSQSLGGSTLTLLDSKKRSFAATLSFMSFGQINFVVPEGVAEGPATVTVTNSTGSSASTEVKIGAVAPGLFSADGSGTGPAAAYVLTTGAEGAEALLLTYACVPFACTMPALTLPANADSYLVLFGTGIRGRSSLSNVSLTLGGIPATVTYAGVQGTFPGLDQVVAKISPANRPAGIVDIRLTVDGIEANPLRMSLR